MSNAYDIATQLGVDTSTFVQKDANGVIEALDGSALTNLPAGGKVLQVVKVDQTTEVTASSSSFQTAIQASITPSSSSSKILVMPSVQFNVPSTADASTFRIKRASTVIQEHQDQGAGGGFIKAMYSPTYLDSPASSSSTQYEVLFNRTGGSGSVSTCTSNTSDSSLTLIEIEG